MYVYIYIYTYIRVNIFSFLIQNIINYHHYHDTVCIMNCVSPGWPARARGSQRHGRRRCRGLNPPNKRLKTGPSVRPRSRGHKIYNFYRLLPHPQGRDGARASARWPRTSAAAPAAGPPPLGRQMGPSDGSSCGRGEMRGGRGERGREGGRERGENIYIYMYMYVCIYIYIHIYII